MLAKREVKNLVLLFGESGISQLGGAIFSLTLSWWITKQTGNTSAYGTVMALGLLPTLIMNLFGGSVADMVSRKKILVITDIVSGVISVALGIYAFYHFNVYVIGVFIIFLNISLSFASPAMRSILRELVDVDKVQEANSILSTISELSKIIGPMLGSLLLMIAAPSWMFILDGISFLIAAVLNSFLIVQTIDENSHFKDLKMIVQIQEGFRYLSKNRILLSEILMATGFNFFAAGISVVQPLYIQKIGGGASLLALTNSVEAGGAMVGAAIAFKFAGLVSSKIYLALAGLAFALSAIFGIYSLVFSFFCYGLLLALFNVQFFTKLQKNILTNFQGRIFSIVYTLASLAMPLGSYVWGKIGGLIIERSIISIGVAIIIMTVCFMLFERTKYENYSR